MSQINLNKELLGKQASVFVVLNIDFVQYYGTLRISCYIAMPIMLRSRKELQFNTFKS